MFVVRKRLNAAEGSPPNTRYNPETNTVETSTDGGLTWNENTGADPRYNPAYQVPPNTEPDVKCAAAEGMLSYIRQSVDAAITSATIVGVGNSVLGLLLFALPISWMYALIWAIAEALVTIGSAALITEFTEDVYDQLRCLIYENLDADGHITQAGLDALIVGADAIEPLVVGPVIYSCILGAGVVGFNNFGSKLADAEGECLCGWCYVLDLATTDGGWTPYGSGQGHWEIGVGIVADNVVVGVPRTIAQGVFDLGGTIAHLTNIAMNYDYFEGTPQSGVTAIGGAFNDFAEGWADIQMQDMADGNDQLVTVPVDIAPYNVFIDLQCSHNAYGGSATATVMTLRGDGEKPTFLEALGWVEC